MLFKAKSEHTDIYGSPLVEDIPTDIFGNPIDLDEEIETKTSHSDPSITMNDDPMNKILEQSRKERRIKKLNTKRIPIPITRMVKVRVCGHLKSRMIGFRNVKKQLIDVPYDNIYVVIEYLRRKYTHIQKPDTRIRIGRRGKWFKFDEIPLEGKINANTLISICAISDMDKPVENNIFSKYKTKAKNKVKSIPLAGKSYVGHPLSQNKSNTYKHGTYTSFAEITVVDMSNGAKAYKVKIKTGSKMIEACRNIVEQVPSAYLHATLFKNASYGEFTPFWQLSEYSCAYAGIIIHIKRNLDIPLEIEYCKKCGSPGGGGCKHQAYFDK